MERGNMIEGVPPRKVIALSMAISILIAGFGIFILYGPQNVMGDAPFTSSIELSDDSASEEQLNSDITTDNAGNLYAVWQDMDNGIDNDIFFTNSSDGGQSWRSPTVLVNGGFDEQTEPSIAANPTTGAIYVAFEDSRGGDENISFVSSIDGGSTWSTPQVQINDDVGTEKQGAPKIIVDIAGTIHAAWEDDRNGDWDIYYSNSQDGGTTWLPNKKVSDTVDNQRYPSIAVGPSGIIYIAWQDGRAGLGDTDIYCANSTDGGQNWGIDNKVSSDSTGAFQERPSIVVDGGDTIYAVWQDSLGGGFDIYSARSNDGGNSWSTNIIVNDVTANNQISPEITTGAGMIHAVWEDPRNGNPDIYYANSTDGGATWGGNIRVDDDIGTGNQKAPSLVFTPPLSVNVVWQDDRWGDNDIYFANILSAVSVNTVDRIFISRSADGSSGWVSDGVYKVNEQDTFYAVGWNDTLNVFVNLVSVDWNVLGSIGNVNPLVGTTTTFTATTAGMGQVTATQPPYGTNLTGMLAVSGGDIDRMFISLSPTGSSGWIGEQFYSVSDSQNFYAVGWNDTNNEFVALVEVDWLTTNDLVGDVTTPGNSTTFTANGDGTCIVSVTHGTYGTNDTGVLTITSYDIDRIFISRSPTGDTGEVDDGSYPVGYSDTFYAVGWNDTSNVFVKLVKAIWSSDAPLIGDVETPGTLTTFSAIRSGSCKVTAANATFGSNETGILEVFELEIDQILISPSPDDSGEWVDIGTYGVTDTDLFYATAWNSSYGKFMGLVDATWSITDDTIGTIDTSGLWINFTALHVSSDSAITVTASFSGLQNSTGSLNVLAPSFDYIQIRDFPEGGGNILDTATFLVGEEDTYFSAGYNHTLDYIGIVQNAQWSISGGIGNLTPTTGNLTRFLATEPGTGILMISFGGLSNQSGIITVEIIENPPPDQPGQPELTVKGKDEISISWPANTESDLKEYVVQRAPSASGPWSNITTVSAGTETHSDSNLEPETTYYYRIIAIDSANNPSEPSPAISATTKKATTDGDGDSPIVLVIIIIVIVFVIIILLFLLNKKKKET